MDLLEEYKAYYAVRAEKYAGNENYKHSYEAEKNLSEAMQSCSILDEFKDKIGDLNEKCAIALTKDQAIMEQKHFEKHQEVIRALTPTQILEKIDECKNSLDIAELVQTIESTNSTKISMDEAHQEFADTYWDMVDDYIIYQNAEVPSNYKKEMQDICNEIKESLHESLELVESNNNEWETNWRLTPEKNLETRHKRLIPFSEDHIREQIQIYKSIINH